MPAPKQIYMKKRVLVYDNQKGYYDLLKDTLRAGYDFRLFNNGNDVKDEYDAVVFFLHDEIEFMDMVKLYNPEKPFVLGSSARRNEHLDKKVNMVTIDLSQTKERIEKRLAEALQTLT